jgi:preprotein translocase subunit SecG
MDKRKERNMATFLMTLFSIVCVLLVIVVLLQKGRGGGLGAAFGGIGSSAFGTRVGDVFTWVTIILTGLFLLLAIGTQLIARPPAEPVEAPLFDPAPGPISEMTPIRIQSRTDQADIYYTVDGTAPKESGNQLGTDGSITISPGTTLKAIAHRKGTRKNSEIRVGLYSKAPPPAVTTLPGESPATPAAPATSPATAPAR